MPYIKLNDSKINYRFRVGSDLFIVSGIIDSSCSSLSPTVIRSKQELDIFFGRNFSERDYFEELIESGVSLLLYKPISSEIREDQNDIRIPEIVEEYICLDEFPEKGNSEVIYLDKYTDKKYIWIEDLGEYLNIENLPQNIYREENLESWYNRDTLRLGSTEEIDLTEIEKYWLLNKNPGLYRRFVRGIQENDKINIHNTHDGVVSIYFSLDRPERFVHLRDGQNYTYGDYVEDLFTKENLKINANFSTGEFLEEITWYKDTPLLQILSAHLNREVEFTEIKDITIIDQFKSVVIKNNISSCFPRYKTDYPLGNVEDNFSLPLALNENPNHLKELLENYRTMAFTLDFSGVIDFSKQDNQECFLCFPIPDTRKKKDYNDTRAMVWINSGSNEIPLGGDIVLLEHTKELSGQDSKEKIISGIIDFIKECGYNCEPDEVTGKENQYIIYTSIDTVPNACFTNIPGLKVNINQTITHDLLSVISDKYKRIEFYSKTIGPNDEDIKIKIEEIPYQPERYRITISRFNYTETFDVNLYDVPDKYGRIESLDHIISRNSRLVECKLFRQKSDGTYWKSGDEGGNLPLGEWYLKRSYYSKPTKEMYWNGLRALKEIDVEEDFLCIPEIELYLDGSRWEEYRDLGYFPEYLEILEYTKHKNCQALIGNLNYGFSEKMPEINEEPQERVFYKDGDSEKLYWHGKYVDMTGRVDDLIRTWGNIFVYNYNLDYDNRLVYFFRDMSYENLFPRPAYYIFLRGILNNTYSDSATRLNYLPPVSNAFIEEGFEKAFEVKKSNYMVSDNQRYFYKTFFNHPGNGHYTTTILTRFSMAKVSRTIRNNRWSFLGKRTRSEAKLAIEKILGRLSSTYSVYKSISMVEYKLNPEQNALTIKLELYLRELVDKPISMDITLNYNY